MVLDTHLVVSALLFPGGRPAELRRFWQQGLFTPLVSRETAAEIVRVLAYPKFRLSLEDRKVLLADYLPYTETVKIPDVAPPVPDCRDPCDVPFLMLAEVGKADIRVTGCLLGRAVGTVPAGMFAHNGPGRGQGRKERLGARCR